MVKQSSIGLGIVTALLAYASPSFAQTYCGTTSASWNVPQGDVALTQTQGPVMQVITAVGEYRSHSMMSDPGGWVTHATSITPTTSNDESFYETPFCSSCGSECWNPLNVNFLYNSTPGLEQVQAGAIYAFLYQNGTNNFLAYQRGTAVNATWPTTVGNYAWNLGDGYGYKWTTSTANSAQGLWEVTYNGAQTHYGWYQYMNLQGAAQGTPGYDTGVICSTSAAGWQHDALVGTAGYTGDVVPRNYKSATITNGANALWNATYSECEGSNGWFASVGSFFTNLGWNALCIGSGESSICSAAADQMVNCFTTNSCGNTSGPSNYNQGQWHGVVASGSATTISPDTIGCWSGNGTGAGCSGSGSSIWGWDGSQTVQWNSGGSEYSCWD